MIKRSGAYFKIQDTEGPGMAIEMKGSPGNIVDLIAHAIHTDERMRKLFESALNVADLMDDDHVHDREPHEGDFGDLEDRPEIKELLDKLAKLKDEDKDLVKKN